MIWGKLLHFHSHSTTTNRIWEIYVDLKNASPNKYSDILNIPDTQLSRIWTSQISFIPLFKASQYLSIIDQYFHVFYQKADISKHNIISNNTGFTLFLLSGAGSNLQHRSVRHRYTTTEFNSLKTIIHRQQRRCSWATESCFTTGHSSLTF